MEETAHTSRPRFRINPVEVVILILVVGGFGLSLYGLFRQTKALRVSGSNARAPSSATNSFIVEPDALRLEISCSKNPGFKLLSRQCD